MKKSRNGFIKNLRYLCLIGVATLGLITIVGTGGGGGGGVPPAPAPTTCTNVAGTWSTTEVVNGTDCGEGTYTEYGTYTVTQNGCNISVTDNSGTYSGTVNGNQISWTGSWPEDGGTTTANISLTISGDSLSGSASWTWSDGTDSCSGTTQISGTHTGGDAGGGVSLADLAGTWYGVLEDPSGVLHTISVTLDGSGNLTQHVVDGSSTGLTSTITKESDQIFSFLDSDGTEGGFFVDGGAKHAGFVDEDFYFGVLEKGASSLPTYANTDIIGSWSGYGIALDSYFDIVETWTSSGTVANDFSFSGSDSDGGTFSGSFSTYFSSYGAYYGDFSNSEGASGSMRVFLSPDKSFVASWAADRSGGSATFPEDYAFECWNKQ